MPLTENTRTQAVLHTAVFLAGWTGIFGRLISLDGLPLVWYRLIVSVITLAAVLAAAKKIHPVKAADALRIAACGSVIAVHWVAFYTSIHLSNVSIGVVCIATSCFFTAFFDPLINRTRFSWAEVLISFMAIAGVLLMFSLDVRYRLGIALGLFSAAMYSLFSIFHKRTAKRTGEDSATMLFYEFAGGAAFLTLCIPLYLKTMQGASIVPSRSDLLWIFLLGSFFTVVPFLFQLHALRTLSAFTVNLAYNLEPVYSIAIAAVVFGELKEVGPSFWAGIVLIVISVLIQSLRSSRRAKDAGSLMQ